MPAHFRSACLVVALAAGLIAFPACNKESAGPGLNLSADKDLIAQSTDNLKRIGAAMVAYEATVGAFPTGIYGPEGASRGLSWRVEILNFMGEEEQALAKKFNLKEPWDSEHNKALIPLMPKVYAAPKQEMNGHTYYCSFEGPRAFIQPFEVIHEQYKLTKEQLKQAQGFSISGRKLATITDGISRTLMVVEAAEPVIWTKPEDIPFDLDKPVPPLGGVFRKVTNVIMADGSLNYIPRDTPPEVIKALITVDNGKYDATVPADFFDKQK
jgi:hypothetical protein